MENLSLKIGFKRQEIDGSGVPHPAMCRSHEIIGRQILHA